jgi:hypothetical protein
MSRRQRAAVRPAVLIGAVCLGLLLPAGAIEPGSELLNTTVTIIQTTPEVLAEAEAELGVPLDPVSGRCVLTADEHAALVETVVGEARGHVLARGAVLVTPGAERAYEDVEQIRIPRRYGIRRDPGDASGTPRVVATEFAQRDVGFVFRSNCLGRPAGGVLPMALAVRLTRVAGQRAVAAGIDEPVIRSWELNATLNAPLNKTVVLVNRPHEPFESSALFRTGNPPPATVMLLLIRVE